ncbi:hypothetical protein EMCG_01873 [[Emmonsia] crescens]|uniref:protein-ribulosamine 3-kinase n=1 Tax=[Emmonsia] crescens TaxID=73230 RepID=A0A0G2J241_9EURO|nr:hypothetical protein EMCG_01873 [Emmonsia crescens UAMH 3008]
MPFAQKLAAIHKEPAPIPEGSSRSMFRFLITTYAGRTKQDNMFCSSWAEFYLGKDTQSGRGVLQLDQKYHSCCHGHLNGENEIKPSLVHGDLWSGNKAWGRVENKSVD